MAEAGELGHWEIVQTMSKTVGEDEVGQLADWAVEIQREHFDGVRDSSLNSLRKRRAASSETAATSRSASMAESGRSSPGPRQV